jgi:hypothetical protein
LELRYGGCWHVTAANPLDEEPVIPSGLDRVDEGTFVPGAECE